MDDILMQRRVAVIGGGPAGMMAAISAARCGAQVVLFEKNAKLGKKLRITGKGRCNVTNDCDTNEFLMNVPTNPRFLYAALNRFSTADAKDFFESAGVELKTERGRRVFPISDKAADIVDAFVRQLSECGVRVQNQKALGVTVEEGRVSGVLTEEGRAAFDAVIIATGGMSYPLTGSDGDGYKFARKLGHTVCDLKPSLVPIVAKGRMCSYLQGVSLKNIGFKIVDTRNGKTVFEDFGEMMFAHFGITGPVVLSASAHISDIECGAYEAHIDLKSALDEKTLDARVLSDFKKYSNKDFINALDDLLPQKMIEPIVSVSGIDPRKKVNSVTKEERAALVSVLKCFKVRLSGFRPIDEAIVTKGGVSVKEVDPKTMQSKLVEGLYFAGEVLDLDAYTGGFNLQIAYSTGYLAGENAAFG